MIIGLSEAWEELRSYDNILLLTHRLPDGDAIGSLFALFEVLKNMGKRVRFILDTPPRDIRFLVEEYTGEEFEPEHIVTVDVGDKKLLGDELAELYGGRIDLSIDHHASNNLFAEKTLVEPDAAAAAEILYRLFRYAGAEISLRTAECLYIGIATDTGCFRYPNTTAQTLRTAAELVDTGIDNGRINTDIFETKSFAYAEFETMVMNSLKLFLDGRCAIVTVTRDMFEKTGVNEADAKSINALPRQIEGVMAGITLKERPDGGFRVSVRTRSPLNAAAICARYGGGGHLLAAGCEIDSTAEEAAEMMVSAAALELKEQDL